MYSGDSSANDQNDVETRRQNRHNLEATSVTKNVKGRENMIHTQDQETMELYSRARAQEKEIQYLREQIALASIRALDEKQSEVITSASNELVRRKGDLEVNLNLLNELKVAEDEKHIFTSSMLGILAEYGALPHVTNASALTNSIKHLHDQLQLKIRASHARLAELNSMIGNNSRNGVVDNEIPGLSSRGSQFPSSSMGVRGFSQYSHYNDGKILDPAHDPSRYVQENDPKQARSLTQSAEMRQLPNNETLLRTLPNTDRRYGRLNLFVINVVQIGSAAVRITISPDDLLSIMCAVILENVRNTASPIMDNMLERNGFLSGSEQRSTDQFSLPPMHDRVGSFGSEGNISNILSETSISSLSVTYNKSSTPGDGPGIEGFQIIGDAKPGCKLLGCGYPVRGTSLCMFQWVRHYPDGTRQYIEGATNPDYVVTADDVDKLIAVECIPMDDQGRQGDLVRIFANDQNKITCDEEMQEDIDTYISKGQAAFSVLILLDSSENWEPATLIMRRSGFQVKDERKQDTVISEKYSKDLLNARYTCADNENLPEQDSMQFHLIVFHFKQALDEKRKGKA
ncbi:hypothetical protein DH2020_046964 [Rehmannia glutinosa]|uniref:AIR9-like A9 domain-containing protein n=1 Tax=Rehmannia glutinosa TaxID=99300 RepID=A0ABR0UBF0_REHGL